MAFLFSCGRTVKLSSVDDAGEPRDGVVMAVVDAEEGWHAHLYGAEDRRWYVRLPDASGDMTIADYYPAEGEYVCWVGNKYSHCSNCGGNASPNEAGHYMGDNPLVDGKGCGVSWSRRVPLYPGPRNTERDDRLNWTDMSKPFWPWPFD